MKFLFRKIKWLLGLSPIDGLWDRVVVSKKIKSLAEMDEIKQG